MDLLQQLYLFFFSPDAPIEAVALLSLIIAMSIDILTGWGQAYINNGVSSKMSWRGMVKKAMTLLSVALVVALIPLLTYLPISPTLVVLPVIGWFLINEITSIAENLKKAGVSNPFLDHFKDAVGEIVLKQKLEAGGTEIARQTLTLTPTDPNHPTP